MPLITSDITISEIIEKLLRKIIEYTDDNKFNDISNSEIHKISIKLNNDLIDYINLNNSFDCKFLWSDRSGNLDIAAFGICKRIPFDLLSNYTARHRIYGGIRFDPGTKNGGIWKKFGINFFFIPKFEFIKQLSTTIYYNFIVRTDDTPQSIVSNAERELSKLFTDENKTNPDYHIVEIKHYPGKEEWESNILKVISKFESGNYKKIVMARETEISFDKPPGSMEIFNKLKQHNPDSFTFYFAIDKDTAFMGASPERLYKRTGNMIHCDALAGTIKRGVDEKEDNELEIQLLNSKKDVKEQAMVAEYLSAKLEEICSANSNTGRLRVRKFSKVQHLYNSISGELLPGISDSDIISFLHPTPAVSGVPQKEAVTFINRVEPFDRGWYAGPIGWIGKDEAEFAVAIRSGLFHNDKLYLYSGAGIVEGSGPKAEWEEINHKLSNFMRIFDDN